jgi:hypothetical protein
LSGVGSEPDAEFATKIGLPVQRRGLVIVAALARSDGNKAAAARLPEISERALWYKLMRYGP